MQRLVKIGSQQGKPVYGVIELVEGEGFVIAEHDNVPLDEHITREIDIFDNDDSIESIESQYKVDLSRFELENVDLLKANQNNDI